MLRDKGDGMNQDIILSVSDLYIEFKIGKKKITPVTGVSFDVKKNRTLALVGESGCGKSITAQAVMQILSNNGRVSNGTITYRLKDGTEKELQDFGKFSREMTELRGTELSMVFQDPMASLNPVYTVGYQITEGLMLHEKLTKEEAYKRAEEMLTLLGIPNAKDRLKDYPHQFSGGMKQRVLIAIAMIGNPNLLIADEPTTALDVTIQAQILDLMKDMQKKFGTTIILITHNMGIVADMADDIAVMYMGKIMEYGTGDQVFDDPQHPYTQALLRSVPVLGARSKKRLESIEGSTPDINDMPVGCAFAPRCPYATEKCNIQPPKFNIGDNHMVRCWRAEGGKNS